MAHVSRPRPPRKPRNYLMVPLVLGKSTMRSLKCRQYSHAITTQYHSSFILSFSCLPSVIHLHLSYFQLKSFTNLRHIICGLTNLRELDLYHGRLTSRTGVLNPAPLFPPVKAPHLSWVHLDNLDCVLFSQLALWMSSTEICCCTDRLCITVRYEAEEPA